MVSTPPNVKTPLFGRSQIILWLAIFFLALGSRAAFLTYGKQLPVFWDARLYASAAVGLLGYFDRDEPFARGINSDQDFAQYYVTYLNGEDIDWLYYKPPSLAEAQKYLFYSGPAYPALLAALFWFNWDNDFQAARWLNAFLDSLGILLLTMAVYILWGRTSAIIAAILQLLYIPSILTCGILALETITSFLISLFLFLAAVHFVNEKKVPILFLGLVGGVLFLTKPTASLLTLPYFAFLGFCYWRRKAFLLRTAALYLVPFILLVLPWTVLTSSYYGRPAIRDPEYSTANLRSSSSITFEGYDLDYADPDFWTYSVTNHILTDPVGYGHLLIKKIIRLWWTPHDEFWQGPVGWEKFYHRFLAIAALLGLAALPLMAGRFWLLPGLVIFYYGGIHLILHALPRYNFNALPALFMVAAVVLYWLLQRIRGRALPRSEAVPLAVSILAIIGINWAIPADWFMALAAPFVPITATVLLMLFAGFLYMRLFLPEPMSVRRRISIWLPVMLLSFCFAAAWSRPQLAERHFPLNDTGTELVTEIQLPPLTRFADNDQIKLVVDLTTGNSCTAPIDIKFNGLLIRFYDARPPISKAFFTKGAYEAFHDVMEFDVGQMRWYRSFQLKPEDINRFLRPDGLLTVAVAFSDSGQIGNGLMLYSDAWAEGDAEAWLPSFSHSSIERFKEFGDRRIYENYQLDSHSGRSYVVRNGAISEDLSPLFGEQKGRFRVYLGVKSADFQRHYY